MNSHRYLSLYAKIKQEMALPIELRISTLLAVNLRMQVETITDEIPVAKYDIPASTAISPLEMSRFFSI